MPRRTRIRLKKDVRGPSLVRRWRRHDHRNRPAAGGRLDPRARTGAADRRRPRSPGHGAGRPPASPAPLPQLAGHQPRHRPEAGRMGGAGHRRPLRPAGHPRLPGVDRRGRGPARPRGPHRPPSPPSRPAPTPRWSWSSTRPRRPTTSPAALEGLGVSLAPGADLHCVTGAGERTVLIRTGTLRPDTNPPTDATPGDDRPWLAGMERLDDPRLARRFVTSRLLYRRLRRYLWAPPLVLAGLALLLRLEFVVRRARARVPLAAATARPAARLRRLVVLAGARHHRHRRGAAGRPGGGRRRHLPRHLAGPRRGGPPVTVVGGRGRDRGRPVDGALAAHPRR